MFKACVRQGDSRSSDGSNTQQLARFSVVSEQKTIVAVACLQKK